MTRSKVAPRRGRKPRAEASRDTILTVATQLFADHGYEAVSIRDIAGKSGVNNPTIYHYFGDKERLYDACYKATFEAIAVRLRQALVEAPTAEQRIRSFTVALCKVFLEDHNFRRLLQREFLREEHRQIAALTTHHFSEEFELVTDAIVEIYGPARAKERAFSIHSLTTGLVLMRRIGALAGLKLLAGITAESLADYVLAMVLPGLGEGRALAARGREPIRRAAR